MKKGEMLGFFYFGLEVREKAGDGRSVRVYSTTGGYDHTDGLDLDGTASFEIPIGGIDVKTTPVYGAWYAPLRGIQNLTQFDQIDLGLNDDRTELVLNIRPASDVKSTSTLVQVFVLHERVA